MSEKTIITTTLVGSHVCIAEEDYDLLTLSANVGYALEKENALLREDVKAIEAKDKLTDNLNKMVVDMLGVDFASYSELQARNELLEKVVDDVKSVYGRIDLNPEGWDGYGACTALDKALQKLEPK